LPLKLPYATKMQVEGLQALELAKPAAQYP